MGVVCIFLFKRGSRNHANNTNRDLNYRKNLSHLFKIELSHLDTGDAYLKTLETEELEGLKHKMVSTVIKKKMLHKYRLFNKYFNVAIDGSGLHSYSYEPYPGCPNKTSKNGKTAWTVYVLEAKIVCVNGFSISIATEWIENPIDEEYEKQDCELKAFKRLALKIKKYYPRLPVCITADGLYPNKTVFNICHNNDWRFIITLKEGNLKSVWEEMGGLSLLKNGYIALSETNYNTDKNKPGKKARTESGYKLFNDIVYDRFSLSVAMNKENYPQKSPNSPDSNKSATFVHITDFELTQGNCREISNGGRLRWKIENEGFNQQKNQGYNMSHKYSRTSFTATCNYYQCLQIAHLLNQLAFKSKPMMELIKPAGSLKAIEQLAISLLIVEDITTYPEVMELFDKKQQFRY